MPDAQEMLKKLAKQGRIGSHPQKLRKIDRQGQARRPDEHLTVAANARERVEEQTSDVHHHVADAIRADSARKDQETENTRASSQEDGSLSARAREITVITRLLRGDAGYYFAIREMRDPNTGLIELPHSSYAKLFDLRSTAIAPLIKRLIDVGAISVVREYDAGLRQTWAYRVAEPDEIIAKPTAPGLL
jgi:hypothetical protein